MVLDVGSPQARPFTGAFVRVSTFGNRSVLVGELGVLLLEEQDPEFSDEYRSVAEGRDPHEGPGEWASLGTPDVKNHPGSGQGPRDQGGQW